MAGQSWYGCEAIVLRKHNRCIFFSHFFLAHIFACVVGSALFTTPLHAQAYDLRGSVERALQIHPGVQAAEMDVAIAQSQLAGAKAARFLPKLDFRTVVGPSPGARGNALIGETDLGDISVFSQTEASFVQPIYTFGKLNGARDAASAGVAAYEAGLIKSKADLELQVFEVFYGLHLTNALWDLAQEADGDFKKAHDFIAEKLENDEGEFTFSDLAKIETYSYDVAEKVHAADKARAMAGSAMRLLLGLNAADSLTLSGGIVPLEVEILPLSAYLELAASRPEMQQLDAVVEARKSLLQMARSDLYPQIFLAGQFKYAYAPNRDDQKSPYAYDPLNSLQTGAVVGFQQSLSFGLTNSRVKMANLEHQKIVYQQILANKGILLEIEKVYRDLKEAEANLGAAEEARRAARRWFVAVRDGFNGGFEKASDMIEAVKEYGIIRAKYLEAVYNFNRGWAKLQRATGRPILQSLGLTER
ncbi:MAG: TolC family protein [bacterium]|nr:TolC family protein [bacterium]